MNIINLSTKRIIIRLINTKNTTTSHSTYTYLPLKRTFSENHSLFINQNNSSQSNQQQDKISLSNLVEKEIKSNNKPFNSFPKFGSQWGKYFNDGSRRLSFNPNQVIKPSDLQLENLTHPADRSVRKPRPIIRRPPTKAEVKYTDPFLYYKINVLKEPYNPELLANYLTPLGRIKKRALTGLSKANQKKVSKAIRRARCMGFLPYFGKPLHRFSDEFQQRRDAPGVDLPPFAR